MKRDRTYRLPCGCFVTNSRIVRPCPDCDTGDTAIRERWAAEHKAKADAEAFIDFESPVNVPEDLDDFDGYW